MKMRIATLASCLLLFSTTVALAGNDTWYLSGSLGYVLQSDSDNSGTTGSFNTGNGSPVIPNGTPIADGTSYGWDTEFEGGWAVSGEMGRMFQQKYRLGLEISYTGAGVDSHEDVDIAGTIIDDVDAAVLTGSSSQLGATVGDVVGDGQGDITQLGFFLNGYYDINTGTNWQPYLGAGIGFVSVDVDYSPSNVTIVDDDETVAGVQFKAGAAYMVSQNMDAYGEYAFRMIDEIKVENSLFPGDLEVDNQQHLFNVGIRYRFSQ